MSITAYQLVEARSVSELQSLIAAQITAGYQPYGYPFMRAIPDDPSEVRIVQAMVTGLPVVNQTNDTTAVTTQLTNAAPAKAVPTSGGTVTVTPTGMTTVEEINPAGTLAALTLTLANGAYQCQMVLVKFSQIITALTVTATNMDATVYALPTSAAVNTTLRFLWDNTASKWVLI